MDTKAILSSLTVDEKIRLLGGMGDWYIYDCNGKVPKVMMTDGPHGLRKIEVTKAGDVEGSNPATCFPTASAMASSWDPDMTFLEGETLAEEALMEKISVVLGCGMNIKRSPFCGRNFEYYSEDPFLAGKMAGGFISGTQSKGIGTSLKHFAVNSQETRRMTSDSIVDERAFREIYLAGFEDCIKTAKPYTVMTSYNRVNGTYAAANKHLLTEILRDEWGYEGAVVSDWGASIDIVACIKAGLNLEMPDPRGYHTRVLKKAYENGEISDELLDERALKILDSYAVLAERVEENHPVDFDKHNEIARKLSANSAVLLKNSGLLPVSKDKKLIIIGDLAENVRFQGGGSSHINPARQKNAVKAFEDAGYRVCFEKGYDRNSEKTDDKLVARVKDLLDRELTEDCAVLFFMGLTDAFEGEGYDRKDLSIPANQTELLDVVASLTGTDKLAAITFGGAPFEFGWENKVSSILHMYLGGQAVGEAVCDLVSGLVNPSGKLAETFPLNAGDFGGLRYFALPHDDVEYRESIFVGYRYYETFGIPVRYPFGYGLSYTTFEYSSLMLDKKADGTVVVSFDITNTGSVAGAEVAQVYVGNPDLGFMRSKIELKGFKKVFLKPGETASVSVELGDRSFSIFDVNTNRYEKVKGNYQVMVAASVKDIRLSESIEVDGITVEPDKDVFSDYHKPQKDGMEISEEQFYKLLNKEVPRLRDRRRGDYDMTSSFGDVAKSSLFGRMVMGIVGMAVKFMFRDKPKNDPGMMMVKMTIQEGALEGLISTSSGMISPKLCRILLYNANRKYGKAFLQLFKKNAKIV